MRSRWFNVTAPVLEAGEQLLSLSPRCSKDVERTMSTLKEHWDELQEAVALRGSSLQDDRDLLEFLQKVEQTEAWIRHKVLFRRSSDSYCSWSHL